MFKMVVSFSKSIFLLHSGIGLHHDLVRDPEIVFGAVKPHHAGAKRYAVRG